MSYLKARRYGLTHVKPTETEHASGWRQVWVHEATGLKAMRHPISGWWMVARDGCIVGEGFSSSLRAAAMRIEGMAR